jgi:predicted RNA-binding protein with PUA-like domain
MGLARPNGPWRRGRGMERRAQLSGAQLHAPDEYWGFGIFLSFPIRTPIVGIVQVIATSHPDSTTDDPRWDCVDIKAVKPVKTPVTLDQVKSHPILCDMPLAKNPRLSVQPVTQEQWAIICAMAGV